MFVASTVTNRRVPARLNSTFPAPRRAVVAAGAIGSQVEAASTCADG